MKVDVERVEAVWHVAVGDTTQGPYTLDELAGYYVSGSVTPETLVFRDGDRDWQPAASVAVLVQRAQRRSAPPPRPRPSRPPLPARAFSMGSDPFGESAGETPRVDVVDVLTDGERHEGTVQFSMQQMRSLSAGSSPSVAPAAQVTASGYATGDDSGLIDMRSLAQAQAQAVMPAPSGEDRTSGFTSTLSPLSVPVGAYVPALDLRTKVLAGLSAFAFVTAALVGVLYLGRSPSPSAPQAAAAAAPAIQAAVVPAAVREVTPAIASAAAVEAKSEELTKVERTGVKRRGGRAGATRTARAEKPAKAGADLDDVLASVDKSSKKSGGRTSIDDLLEGAVSGKKSAPKAEAPKESKLPATPGREQMLAALTKAKAKAAKCKGPGVATADITIAGNTGRASKVAVSGTQGAAKTCVEKAVRSTAFPKFQKPSFDVKFPFKLGA